MKSFLPIRMFFSQTGFFGQPRGFWAFLGLILFFRLWLMQFLDLIDDEAYHWTWSRYLNWSYFDHPGMVGWSIWPFTELAGAQPFALRLPGFLYVLGISLVLYRLGKEIFSPEVGRWAVGLLYLVPLWGFASIGTLPDVPLAFFWLLCFYFFWQGVRPDSRRWPLWKAWMSIGFAMGLGMNSKLACCLLGLGFAVVLIATPRLRSQLKSPWPYLATALTFLMMTPILWWNSQNSWATFKYQFARRHTEDLGVNWARWGEFILQQSLLMSPGMYGVLMLSLGVAILRWNKDFRLRLIAGLALPSLVLFYQQPLFAAYKPHWSGPSYLILLLGACHLFISGFGVFKPRSLWLAIPVGIFLFLLQFLYLPLVTPLISKIGSRQSSWDLKNDFSSEFYGWVEAARAAKKWQDELGGPEKVYLGAQRYELISQLTWGLARAQELAGERVIFNKKAPLVWAVSNETNQFFFDQLPNREVLWDKDFIIVNNNKYHRDPRDFAQFKNCAERSLPIYREPWTGKAFLEPSPNRVLSRIFYLWHCSNLAKIEL